MSTSTSGGNTSGEQKEDLTEQGNLMEQSTLIKKQTLKYIKENNTNK